MIVTLAKNTALAVSASDVSTGALEVAKANAIANGLKVNFFVSDLFKAVEGKFDLITANPPYIPTADIDKLDVNVKNFEPRLALDGGVDGLDLYHRIAETAREHLSDNGTLLLEFGIGQGEAMKNIFKVAEDFHVIFLEYILHCSGDKRLMYF